MAEEHSENSVRVADPSAAVKVTGRGLNISTDDAGNVIVLALEEAELAALGADTKHGSCKVSYHNGVVYCTIDLAGCSCGVPVHVGNGNYWCPCN